MPNLEITKHPDSICLADSEMFFVVKSANFKQNNGSHAITDLLFPQLPTEGDFFTLFCDDFSEKFTFVETPDESGNQISSNNPDWDNLRMNLLAHLQGNYFINKYFDLSWITAEHKLRFTSKEAISITLELEDQSTTGTDLSANGSGGSAAQYRNNYRLDASLDILKHEESLIPSIDDLQASFDFTKLLGLKGSFTFPENEITFTSMPDMLKAYQFNVAENIDGEYSKIYGIGQRHVLSGGISIKELAALDSDNSSWWTKQQASKRFLTHQPDGQVVDLNSTLKLYFLNLNQGNSKLVVSYSTSEGSVNLPESVFDNLDAYTVYEIIISPALLLASLGDNVVNVQSFNVSVKDSSNTALTEKRTYYMDWRYQEFRREVLFMNSFKCFETLRFTGKASHSFELESSTSQHVTKYADLNQLRRSGVKLSDPFTINTGWLPSAIVLEYMQELLLSPEIYEIRNGRLYPLILLTSKVNTRTDGEYNYSLDLKFVSAASEEFYSNVYGVEPGAPIGSGSLIISGGSESGGGHIIVDPDGVEMPQRSKLQFTGDAVTVTDDEGNDTTIIDIDPYDAADELYLFHNLNQ